MDPYYQPYDTSHMHPLYHNPNRYNDEPQHYYDPMTQRFKDSYPKKYVVIHSLAILLLSLAAIAIQIVLIVNSAALSLLSSGIWIGVFYIVAVTLAMLNIKYPGYCLYTASSLMHSIGIMMTVTAMLSVNVIAYTSLYKCNTNTNNNVYGSFLFNSNQKCGTPDVLHIPMMVIASLYVILSIVYLSVMACALGECGGYRNNKVKPQPTQYNRTVMSPPNMYQPNHSTRMMY